MQDFLNDNSFLFDRINAGIDIHPSDNVLKEFQTIAKKIDSERYFTVYGCQSCIQELVSFVYKNQDKITTKTVKQDVKIK